MAKDRIVEAAAIYARISSDRSGDALGVERQQELCSKLAAEKGWPVARTFVDNDVSAYSRKRRPAYEEMVAAIEAGQVDAVLCVDLDRLTRRPQELEAFIDLADAKKIALANISGDADLSTSDGRFRARILGAVARQESEKKSERQKREREHAARNGLRRGGRRPFGYEADGVTVRPEEAELIREACRRVLANESMRSIALDWGSRGVVATQTGRAWTSNGLRHVLINPRIAGLRRYRPRDAHDRVVSEAIFDAQWPAIVDRETFERVSAALRSGRTGPGRPASRMLTGIARCSTCDSPMFVGTRTDNGRKRHRYGCRANPGTRGCGRVQIAADVTDAIITEAVLHALSSGEFARALRQQRPQNPDDDRVADELADAELRMDELARDFGDGRISRREWITARDRLSDRIEAMRRRLRPHRSAVLDDLPAGITALRAKWESSSLEWKRTLLAAVLQRVDIHPAPVRGRFDAERIVPIWRV